MILDDLIKKNKVPTLFIGSGISKRYLKNYPTWYELLRKIALKLDIKPIQLNAIKQNIIRQNNLENSNDVNPLIADELSRKLTEYIINGSELINDIFKPDEIEQLGNYQCDYFKYLISKEFSTYELKDNKIEEISLFKKIVNKIGTVITTNYDDFLEKEIFSNFEVKYKQSQLYYVDSYEYETIYKIHGTHNSPDSIIINSSDYKNIEQNSRLFIAKIYNLLMSSPMIFLGYGMNDEDVLSILSKFTECFDTNTLLQISKNIIIVDYKENEKNILENITYIKCNGKNIPVTVLQTDNFCEIYKYLEKIELYLKPSEVNRYRKVLHKLLKDNENGLNTIKVLGENTILDVDPNKMVVAIGDNNIINTIQEYGVIGFSFKEIVRKVLFEEELNVNLIVEKWYAENVQETFTMPSFYFSKFYNGDFTLQNKFNKNYLYLKEKFDKKYNNMRILKLEYSLSYFDEFCKKNELSNNDYKNLFIAYFQRQISSEKLREILKTVYLNNNNEIRKTSFKELVCLLDYEF